MLYLNFWRDDEEAGLRISGHQRLFRKYLMEKENLLDDPLTQEILRENDQLEVINSRELRSKKIWYKNKKRFCRWNKRFVADEFCR